MELSKTNNTLNKNPIHLKGNVNAKSYKSYILNFSNNYSSRLSKAYKAREWFNKEYQQYPPWKHSDYTL